MRGDGLMSKLEICMEECKRDLCMVVNWFCLMLYRSVSLGVMRSTVMVGVPRGSAHGY